MTITQSESVTDNKPMTSLLAAEAERMQNGRSELNREMLRLPIEERRRRWNEYYTRLDDLMKGSAL